MTQKRKDHPGIRRHQEERKWLAINGKGKNVGIKKRLKTYHPYKIKTMVEENLEKSLYIYIYAVIPHFHLLSLFQSTDWLMRNKPVFNKIPLYMYLTNETVQPLASPMS